MKTRTKISLFWAALIATLALASAAFARHVTAQTSPPVVAVGLPYDAFLPVVSTESESINLIEEIENGNDNGFVPIDEPIDPTRPWVGGVATPEPEVSE